MKKIFFILSISLMMLVSSFPYNFISNQDNAVYAEGTTTNTDPVSNKLENGSFEDGQTWTNAYSQPNQSAVPSWNTTAFEGKIEMFRENTGTYISGVTLKPTDGSYAAELNADEESTLYQIVSTTPSSIYEWGLDHGSRNGTDTMALVIGPAQSVNPSKPSKDGRDQFMQMIDWLIDNLKTEIKTSDKKGMGEIITLYTKKFGASGTFENNADNKAFSLTPSSIYTEEWKIWIIADSKATSGTNPWGKYGLNADNATYDYFYTIPSGQNNTVFAFVSVGCDQPATAADKAKTYGNFLDNVNFKLHHMLTGSTSSNGRAEVSSSGNTHTITVDNELLTYITDGNNLTVKAIVDKDDVLAGCEFAGMYYTYSNERGIPTTQFIELSGNVVEGSDQPGKWKKTILENKDIEYKYILDNITTTTDIHFVFLKSPTITYDSTRGKPYQVER